MKVTAYSTIVTQLTLLCICTLAFSLRLFSVVKYESVIHGARCDLAHAPSLAHACYSAVTITRDPEP